MKNFKYITLFILGALLFNNCTPQDDNLQLENVVTADQVVLTATGSTPGGNEITLKMETPGVTGIWNYNTGVALANEVTFVYPIFGTSTFTFKGTLGGEFFEKTVDYTVAQIDHPVAPEWSLLAGDTAAGKDWVFDGSPGDGRMWWYMVAPFNPAGWQGAWWNAGGTCCPPTDVNGKMHFDLNGSANYTYYKNPNATGVPGSFALDVDNKTLQIFDTNILGAQEPRGNPDAIYTIISLTTDKLILYTQTNGGGTGWVWVFKKA